MTLHEAEFAQRLANKMAADYAKGDFSYTEVYYMREVCLDLMKERDIASSPTEKGE